MVKEMLPNRGQKTEKMKNCCAWRRSPQALQAGISCRGGGTSLPVCAYFSPQYYPNYLKNNNNILARLVRSVRAETWTPQKNAV